jgi:hypothetical protein
MTTDYQKIMAARNKLIHQHILDGLDTKAICSAYKIKFERLKQIIYRQKLINRYIITS